MARLTSLTRGRVALSAVLVAAALVVAAPPLAYADPDLGSARQRAAALATEVERLEVQVALAVEEYDAAASQLGSVVQQLLLAQQRVTSARDDEDSARAVQAQRVRALWTSGGQIGLLASVLEGTSPTDVLARLDNVSRVLDGDARSVAVAGSRVDVELDVQQQIADLVEQRGALEEQVAQRAATVERLLGRRTAELSSATAEVARLAEVERLRRLAEAEAAAVGMLGSSGSLTPPALPAETPPAVVAAITAGLSRVGSPYVWGATGPSTFDCSGLTGWAYKQAGVTLPRTSREQWTSGPQIPLSGLRAGDLLFWANVRGDPATIHHVAMYLGDGLMLQAPQTGDVVKVSRVRLNGFIGAVRPTG